MPQTDPSDEAPPPSDGDQPDGQPDPVGGGEAEELRRRLRKGLRMRRSAPSVPPPTHGRGAGEPGAAGKPTGGPKPIVFRRDLPRREPPRARLMSVIGPHVELAEAVEGAEAVAPDGSRAWLVERRLGSPGCAWEDLCRALDDALARDDSCLRQQLALMGLPGGLPGEELIFFDLETTGLGSSPLFLIGTMVWQAGRLITRQFFARDYSEERAVLGLFLELAAGRELLVSFNGKSFDLPYVRTRSAANGIPCPYDPPHLDLLHVARRIWRDILPDCKLQTLERHVCGRLRGDDIPGHLIPDAYHEYVRTSNAIRMVNVLEHNFLDLLTLADILVRMPDRAEEGPAPPDRFGMTNDE